MVCAAMAALGLVCALKAQAQLAPVGPTALIVPMPPPPPVNEIKPHHTGGQIWIPGYWNWNGKTFVWQAGHFDHERRGAVYVPATWIPAGKGWALVPGHWAPT